MHHCLKTENIKYQIKLKRQKISFKHIFKVGHCITPLVHRPFPGKREFDKLESKKIDSVYIDRKFK